VAGGAVAIVRAEYWFSRLGLPLEEPEVRVAAGYVAALNLPASSAVEIARDWGEAEAIIRDPRSGIGWWEREETERKLLMREMQRRIGAQLLLDRLTAALEGHAESTLARAMKSCGDEALAKVASGAALTSIHLRALALLAGREASHAFVQKYALFTAGRFPLGMRGSTFILF
jgi:hypothetical protein